MTEASDTDGALIHSFIHRAGEGGGLPPAQLATLESCLALHDEVELVKNGATHQDVDPGIEDLIPRGQPDAHLHQALIAAEVISYRSRVRVEGGPEAKDLQT